MDSFFGFFLILLITYETTAEATTDATYTSPASTDIPSETASTTVSTSTGAEYTSPVTTDIPTTVDFELVPVTTTPKSIPDGSHASLKAEPGHGTESTTIADRDETSHETATHYGPESATIPDGSHASPTAEPGHGTRRTTIADRDETSHETATHYGPESATNAPHLGPRSGTDFDSNTDLEVSTTAADLENSTHINLETIKNEVLSVLKPTKEIIDKLEGASTSKPAEPLSKDTTAKRSVTQGEAAGILIGSLIVAVAFICVTKVVYNRYKMKTYDVARNTMELGNP